MALIPLFIFWLLARYLNLTIVKIISAVLVAYFMLDILAVVYKIITHFSFNFFYFWYNRAEAFQTLVNTFGNFWLVLVILLLFSYLLYRSFLVSADFFSTTKKYWLQLFLVVVLGMSIILAVVISQPVEIAAVVADSWKINTKVAKLYDNYYWQTINNFSTHNSQVLENLKEISSNHENVFFIHLESLNNDLVSPSITPNFYNLAQQGTIFQNMQTANIQTIRSEENILCSILPSLRQGLHYYGIADLMVCLPKIMKKLGYRTIFFKSHSLQFSDTGDFMLSLGFDEVHNGDLMRPTDQVLKWGYREDIFYQRVFEYLETIKDEKVFAYIAVSTTNHAPFNVITPDYADLRERLPYQQPVKVGEKIGNSTYLQDYFFGQLLSLRQNSDQASSTMFVFGDQAWPTGKHGNYHNEINAWQENFISSLAIVAPSKIASKQLGLKFDYVSQNDFMPTLLGFLGVGGFKNSGRDLFANSQPAKCIVSAQPYSRVYLSVIRYPLKYIYNILDNQYSIYNLADDPAEKNQPLERGDITDKEINFLEQCLQEIAA